MNKKLFWVIILSAIASATLSFISCHNVSETVRYLQVVQQNVAVSNINETDLKEWATELSGDDYAGRQAGYNGNNKAAKYIAAQFEKMGIKPAGDIKAYIPESPPKDKVSYFQHFSFNTSGTGSVELMTQNVVGVIEGSDPILKKQIIVLGAHYDHVGQTGEGYHYARLGRKKGIWHGADDNASGTVTVMSIAKAFAEGNFKPKRTVVFILFSAEEGGLIGSKYYCKHPTVGKIEDYVFMLNLDMIGRNPNQAVEIKGMASAVGTYLRDVASDAVSRTNLFASIQAGAEVSGGDSDHSSFEEKGVSFVFFFTGFHDDYHTVTDTADKLAYSHMALIGKTAFFMLRDIADRPSPPVFNR
jgi:Zn-dependent M28 family amino/carboxypeptidase